MIKETLLALLGPYGPSGFEGEVSDMLRDMLKDYTDELRTDVLGNLIAVKHGREGGKRLLFSAHMDHIGLIVIDVDKHGFLRVTSVGGVSAVEMIGQHVTLPGGVRGVVSVQEDITAAPTIGDLFIDIGAESREEALALAPIGSVAVYANQVSLLGAHRIAAPAMDDRAGCAILAELLMELEAKDCPNEIVCVFSTQEEVGMRGARVAGYAEQPDVAIALDVTAGPDIPGAKPKMALQLGAGPAVKIMDRSLICTPSVRDALFAAGQEAGVSTQREVLPFGGTDAGAIQATRGGVAAGALSVCTRYVHGAIETIDLRDMQGAVDLLKAFVQRTF